jgi:rRNA maturation endonuclease Nob1
MPEPIPLSFNGRSSMAESGRIMGPVDALIVKFPGNKFTGEIIPELADLVQKGIIRVIDLVFIMRDETGQLVKVEAKDLEGEMGNAYRELARHTDEWFSEADIEVFAEGLAKNSSADFLLFENVWAIRFKEALKNAHAELVDMGRIPPETILKAERRIVATAGV